jgi:hypothetical protein
MSKNNKPDREKLIDNLLSAKGLPGTKEYMLGKIDEGQEVAVALHHLYSDTGEHVGYSTIGAWLKRWRDENGAA